MNNGDDDHRGFFERVVIGLIGALVLFLLSLLLPGSYDMRIFVTVLGFIGGFFFSE